MSYQLKSILKSNRKQLDIHSKLIKLYARKGRYDKAISHAECIYYKESHHDVGFVLANLYRLNGELDKSEEILKSNIPLGDNLIADINALNDSINHNQLLKFIYSYLNDKKVNVSFINVINKGKRLKHKSVSENNLISNQDMYVKDRPLWANGLIAPEYIQNLYNKDNDYISKGL